MQTVKIIGTGSSVPEKRVTNDDLAKIMDTSDEWIRSRTGIGERRITEEKTTADLAAEAAVKALENAGMEASELDLILVATSSPEYYMPNTACEVQAAIGAVNAAAFDLNAACSGFIFALNTAYAFISSGLHKNTLVIGADVMSKMVNWKDRGTCVLFGDGAGAAVVTAAESQEEGIRWGTMGSDGARKDVLTCRARANGNFLIEKEQETDYIYMDGQEVFKFAVKKIPECVTEILEKTGEKKENIAYFILHQANYRIIEAAAKRLRMPIERFPMNIERYGNTSGASVPILLDEMNRKGLLKKGDKLILAGFGAGLTWGATLLTW